MVESNDLQGCIKLYNELSEILGGVGLEFHKWVSNSNEFLKALNRQNMVEHYSLGKDETIKSLGLLWKPTSDNFHFKYTRLPQHRNYTKRILLSESSKVFDPKITMAFATHQERV